MAYRVHIYLKRSGTQIAVDLGEKELETRPIRHGRAQFEHEGKKETGHIEHVEPADWDSTGTVPRVVVVQLAP